MKKLTAIIVALTVALGASAAPLAYLVGSWEIRTIFNDGQEVVQWNYNHTPAEHAVIEIKIGDEWVTPLSNYDGSSGAAAYTARIDMALARVRFLTAEDRQALANLLANKAGEVERSGGKVFNYALTSCGQLKQLH